MKIWLVGLGVAATVTAGLTARAVEPQVEVESEASISYPWGGSVDAAPVYGPEQPRRKAPHVLWDVNPASRKAPSSVTTRSAKRPPVAPEARERVDALYLKVGGKPGKTVAEEPDYRQPARPDGPWTTLKTKPPVSARS
jgi:hypothetical protein